MTEHRHATANDRDALQAEVARLRAENRALPRGFAGFLYLCHGSFDTDCLCDSLSFSAQDDNWRIGLFQKLLRLPKNQKQRD
jgi:hypothetical protein